jgi:PAS domain S-box-containing protein
MRDFLENATLAMHSIAADGTIVWANKAELALLGYESREYIGHHLSEFHLDSQVVENILQCIRHNKGLCAYDARLRAKNGSIRHVRIYSNVRRQDEESDYTSCFTVDVTDKKQDEQASLLLSAIVESSDDAIISKDLNGVITSWNHAAERIFAYKAEEIVGQSILLLIPEELQGEETHILTKIRAGERIDHFETVRVRKDGERLNVSLTISPVKNQNGEIVGVAKIARDITQKKNAERESLLLSAIVESSDDAIVSKDLNGIVTSWNKAAERIFGYKAEEMVGKPVLLLIPPELQDQETQILRKIRAGEQIDHFETVRVKKNGERLDVSLTISPVRNRAGKIVGAAKIVRDITQQKKLEETLRVAEKISSVGRLAATVAHEINNPLEAVTNLIYLAKLDLGLPDTVRTYLNSADKELARVAHITQQTLGFYRDTSRPKPLVIADVVDEVLAIYERKAKHKELKIETRIQQRLSVDVLSGELKQILSNLIANAIDACRPGGKIVVSARNSQHLRSGCGIRITVADNGAGISREDKRRLFTPFFTTKKDVGTGLGLWITKDLLERKGGRIRFRSSQSAPSGTIMTVFLPVPPASIERAA